jgi:type I restriction enzyme S subunit
MNQAWPTKRLADVCQILGGATPSKKNPKFYGGDIPWATVGDMNVEIITTTEEYITKAAVADCSTNVIPSGSIVMATRVGLGKVCVLGQDTAINQDLKGLTPKNTKELTTRWLFWWLKSKASDIQKAGTGATVQGVKMTFVQELEIPLPPLAEQKRIVALLDEAFARIDDAKAKAERNDQAAADFFESRLSELFLKPEETPSMISDHCTEVTVGYVGPMADKYVPNGIPFLRSQNVRPFEINFENLMQITPAFEKSLSKSRLAPGDVVVVRTGYPGTAAVIPTELPMANCADLVILRPMKSLDPNYLVAFFNSKVGKDMVLGRLVGAAQKHFNVGAAKSVLLPIPTIQRQREVVAHISEIRTHVGKLMDNSKAKLSELSELKTSILAQAFAGELTA